MSIELQNIGAILQNTSRIIAHQREIEILKGENFNVFSILKMESKENATHSAFLGELLNPKGSHSKGNTFLKLFLETIGYIKDEEKIGNLNIETASVKLEHHIGKKDIKNISGGRIDIYIWDDKGNSMSIENKIYANDEKKQIARYYNHNKGKNKVYYLTLDGKDASVESKVNLIEGDDYNCISYSDTIVNWLEYCLKEAAEQPILRETIKQYIILIKKLTNQLTNKTMNKEIQDLIFKYYESSKIISENIGKVELKETYLFLQDVKTAIENKLKEGWNVTIDNNLNENWSGLEVTHSTWDGIKIKLEGQSKIPWNDTIYGINANSKKWDRNDIKSKLATSEILKSDFKETTFWPYYKKIFTMNNTENKSRLFDFEKRRAFVQDISEQLIELALECETLLKDVKKV